MANSKRQNNNGFNFSEAFNQSFNKPAPDTEVQEKPESKIDFASAFQKSFEEEKKNGGSKPSQISNQPELNSEVPLPSQENNTLQQVFPTKENPTPFISKEPYKGFFGIDVSAAPKEFNQQFEDLTGYKGFDLTEPTAPQSGSLRGLLGSDLQKKREENFEDKKKKAYEAEMPKVDNLLNNVYYGTIPAEQIEKAVADPFTKNIIQNKVNEIAPEYSDLSNPENVINAAKKIKQVNRKNYAKAEQEGIFEGDRAYNTIVSELTPAKPKNFEPNFSNKDGLTVDLTGSNSLVDRINETQAKLSVTDFDDPKQLSNAIANVKDLINLQSGYYEGEKREQEIKKSVNLYELLDNRIKFNTSKEGISPKLSPFNTQIETAVIGQLSQIDKSGNKTDITQDDSAINQFKWGLTLIEKTDPILYKNITDGLAENKGVDPNDFSHVMKVGQEISNMTIVREAATNPELIDKETNTDYTSYSERKALVAGKIAQKAQELGLGEMISMPESIIKKLGKDVGGAKNIVDDLAKEEQIPFYDAIPKSDVGSAMVRGVTNLLAGGVNTFMTFGESPAESYLRGKSLDLQLFKGQQIPLTKNRSTFYSNKTQKDEDSIAIGVAEGASQFLGQLALTYAAGGLLLGGARVATLGMLNPTGKLAESIIDYGGTALSMYAQTYGDTYQSYLNKTGDVATSKLAANIDAWTQGIIETALPTTKIARAGMKGLRTEFTDGIVDVIKKGGDISMLRDKGRGVIKKYATGVLKVMGVETTEEEVQNLEGFISEYIFSPQTAKDRNLAKESWDIFKATTVSLAVPALFGGIGDARTRDFTKSSLHKAAINNEDYISSLKSMRDKGHLSDEEYNKGVKLINTHKQSIESAPDFNANGDVLNSAQKLDYALEDTKIKVYDDKIKNTTGVQKEMWEQKKKASEDAQRKILIPETKAGAPEEITQPIELSTTVSNEEITQPKVDDSNEAIRLWDEKVAEGNLGIFKNIPKEEGIRMVAEQAQNISGGTDTDNVTGDAYESTVNQFGQKLVDAAIKKYPKDVLIAEAQIGKTVQATMSKIENSEPINENEISDAENNLYDILDRNPNASNLIEPLILKVQNYDNKTKTETVETTEKVPTGRTTKTKISVKPILEQGINAPVTVRDAKGNESRGILRLEDGNYIVSNENGDKVAAIGEKAINDRDLSLPDEVGNPIGFDKDGNVKSVTVKTRNGSLITINNPEKALDIAIQLRAQEIGEIPDAAFDQVYNEVVKKNNIEVPVSKVELSKKAQPKSEAKVAENKPTISKEQMVEDVNEKYRNDLHELSKIDVKLDFVSEKDLVKSSDPLGLRDKQRDIRKRYLILKKLAEKIDC